MANNIMANALQSYGITALPEDTVVAMAYVPYQIDNMTVNEEQGLNTGTMFPVLNKPFECGGNEK